MASVFDWVELDVLIKLYRSTVGLCLFNLTLISILLFIFHSYRVVGVVGFFMVFLVQNSHIPSIIFLNSSKSTSPSAFPSA